MRRINSTIALTAFTLMLASLSSCKDNYKYNPDWKRPHNEFNFSTERAYELRLEYSHTKLKNYIFFRIYDKNPLCNEVLDENLEPIFVGVTTLSGTYYGNITLPAYIKEVYIYTDNFYAQQLIKAQIENGSIHAIDSDDITYEEPELAEGIAQSDTVSLTENVGIYCFEDTWPNEGDYDFNDVVAKCRQTTTWSVSRTHTRTKSGKSGDIYSGNMRIEQVELIVKAYQGNTNQDDGLYCYVDFPNGMEADKDEYFIRRPGEKTWSPYTPARPLHMEELYNKHGGFKYNKYGVGNIYTVWLTNSIRNDGQGCEYKVVLNYLTSRKSVIKTSFRPFIAVRNGFVPYSPDVPYYEIHVPFETPTNIMPLKYWSTTYDASLPASISSHDEGFFFIRAYEQGTPYDANYPFAMKLSGATEQDAVSLITPNNEGLPISMLYKDYVKWVETDGEEYADWYRTGQQSR